MDVQQIVNKLVYKEINLLHTERMEDLTYIAASKIDFSWT